VPKEAEIRTFTSGMNHNCIIILGPTASGKTKLAVETARACNGEIISIDSRQVYKKLDIGTGKDLHEYEEIPYHLIDLVEPALRYNVHAFAHDFYNAFGEIRGRGKMPVLCGGTGLYFDTILKKNDLIGIPVQPVLRSFLEKRSREELLDMVDSYKYQGTYRFDTSSTKRLIRAIEILGYLKTNAVPVTPFQNLKPLIFAPKTTLEQRRKNISLRLKHRLENGMIEEARGLLEQGVSHEQLQYFGLEYKFLSLFLQNKINMEQLYVQLETAIHQYAKRQMTWWRKMEREGYKINWVENKNQIANILNNEMQ